MKPILIAAVLDSRTFIINHGQREHMRRDTLLRIEDGDKWVALLEVKRIYEKMALITPVWAHEHCPVVKVGQGLWVVDPELYLGVK